MTRGRASWTGLAGAAAIVAALLIAYSDSYHGVFVFDDSTSIGGNPTIHHLTDVAAIWRGPQTTVTAEGRPLLNLSLAINWALGKENVVGYHLANLAIHAAAALLLMGVLHRLLRRQPGLEASAPILAWSVALLWAVHPLQTEAVTYIVQRAESLMGLFYLLTLYAYIRGVEEERRGWFLVATAAAYAGMATKEDMVSVPVAVCLCHVLILRGRPRYGVWAMIASSWALLVYLIHGTGGNRGGSIGFGLDVEWMPYWGTQFVATARYLALSFWPHPLVFEYGSFSVHDFGTVWPQALLVGALLAATLWAFFRAPAAAFAAFCFWAVLAPTSLIPGTTQMIVEHRMYLPLACVIVIPAAWAGRRWPGPTVGVLVAAAVVAMGLTWRRNLDYADARLLWKQTVKQRPKNTLAWVMLGDAYRRAGQTGMAIATYRAAIALQPRYPLAQQDLGELLAQQPGGLNEAMEHFRAAMRVRATYPDAHDSLGQAFSRQGDSAAAIGQFRRAVALKPGWPTPHYHLARELEKVGQKEEAAREFRAVIALDPDYGPAREELSRLGAADATADGSNSAALPNSSAASAHRP